MNFFCRNYEFLTKKKPNIKDVKFYRKKNQFWYGWKNLFHDFCDESVFSEHIYMVKGTLNEEEEIFSDSGFYQHLNIFLDELHNEAQKHVKNDHFLKRKNTGGNATYGNSQFTDTPRSQLGKDRGFNFNNKSDMLSDSQILGSIDIGNKDKGAKGRSQPSDFQSQNRGVYGEFGLDPIVNSNKRYFFFVKN